MRACIVGAGVIGLTTEWELAESGYEVTVVDRQREAGAETSFANGAQLSYSYVAPLASPDTLRKLPKLILSYARGPDPHSSDLRPGLHPLGLGLPHRLQRARGARDHARSTGASGSQPGGSQQAHRDPEPVFRAPYGR